MDLQQTRNQEHQHPRHNGVTAQHRQDQVDVDKTGNTVRQPDPAASPLGTDEEAAGTPVHPRFIEPTLQSETTRDPARHRTADTSDASSGAMDTGPAPRSGRYRVTAYLGIAAVLAAAALLIGMMMATS